VILPEIVMSPGAARVGELCITGMRIKTKTAQIVFTIGIRIASFKCAKRFSFIAMHRL
jgi:uncharacterized protein (DUF433 family)